MTSQHWAKQQERGSKFFLNLTRLIVQYLPLWAIRAVTFLVVCYFYATSNKARRHIKDYQTRLKSTYPQTALPQAAVFRQFLAFGESITDRFAVWQRKIRYQDLTVDDADNLYADMDTPGGRGQILVCSHFGNIEVCRALVGSGHHPNFRLNVLVHNKHAQAFNQALVKAGADDLPLIQVTDLDAAKMLELSERIERGEWIAIAADRIPVRGDKTQAVDFLGKPAHFPEGAWLLASLLKAPINTVFCLKEQGGYRLKLRRFSPAISSRGKARAENIRLAMQNYAHLLEKECAENPLLWFNFYDFWSEEAK
ncbi:glycosyl transferase family 2 [Pasteurellaceae bacterium RH1A]|nr:glycosyl transferase family 2 [Pasteurellaceae bacterium RH1A]